MKPEKNEYSSTIHSNTDNMSKKFPGLSLPNKPPVQFEEDLDKGSNTKYSEVLKTDDKVVEDMMAHFESQAASMSTKPNTDAKEKLNCKNKSYKRERERSRSRSRTKSKEQSDRNRRPSRDKYRDRHRFRSKSRDDDRRHRKSNRTSHHSREKKRRSRSRDKVQYKKANTVNPIVEDDPIPGKVTLITISFILQKLHNFNITDL